MIRIGQRPIGPEHPVYLIAELSANHRQDISIALETIRAMADAGADAIKLQTYTADTLTLPYRTAHCTLPRTEATGWICAKYSSHCASKPSA